MMRRDGQGRYAQIESNDAIVSRLAQEDNVPWFRKRNLRLLYLLTLPTCFAAEMALGFDGSMVNGLQAVSSWLEYYHHPRSVSLGLMVSMYSLGSLAAVPFVSSVVDKIGRRYSILFGSVISIIGGILQGSALNFAMFIIARFILGFASVFCTVAAASLIGELSHPKERAVMGGLFITSYDLGAIAAAAVTLQTFSMSSNLGWRIPSFLQVVPSLLQVCFIWFIPESPRWLVSVGRQSEAYAIIIKYHAEGDECSDFAKAEYSQIEQTLETEMKVSQMSNGGVFSTPGMRKRVIIATFLGLFTEWSGIALLSHYLPVLLDSIGIHSNRTKNIISLAKYSWGFVSGAVIALIAPRYPRRRMFLACTISVLVVFVAWTAANAEYSINHSKVAAQVALALIFFYGPVFNLAFGTLTYPFLVELFPFHARTKGLAIYKWWNRIAGFFAQLVNPIGIDTAGWRWYIVYCVWNAFQVVFVYFMFPETSGRTLEELTFLYEDDQEVLRRTGAETLCAHEEPRAYGTMESDPRRTGYGE